MKMKVEPDYAGMEIQCPGCETKIKVPAESAEAPPAPAPTPKPTPKPAPVLTPTSSPPGKSKAAPALTTPAAPQPKKIERKPPPDRAGWAETDPANANTWAALGIGFGISALIWGIAFVAPEFIKKLVLERGWVNFAEVIFFGWGFGILILKVLKLKHQRTAMAIDVLPVEMGRDINRDNVGSFVEYLYEIPAKLRDSMMVNRIRKGLELFEARQVNAEVATMMENQSGIDSTRISGSYASVKLFIAIIPLFGFIGTVLGLSGAIGEFSTALGGDAGMDGLMDSLKGVTSGLGTAFDTTLLGLLLSIILMIPSGALQKIEDDNLNHVDAYCNETLMPRLNDGSNAAGGDMSAFMDAMVIAFNTAQHQYLDGINKASNLITEQSSNMEKRADENLKHVRESFANSVTELSGETKKSMEQMLSNASASIDKLSGTLTNADKYVGDLGKSVATTSTHAASLDKNSKEQAQMFQNTMEKSIKLVQEESSKVLTNTMKTAVSETTRALEGLVKPTSEQLAKLGASVENATTYVKDMERKAAEQQERIQKTLQEAIEKTQAESSRVLDSSMKDAVERTQSALAEMSKSAGTEVSRLGETVKKASEEAGNLGRIAQENQSKLAAAMTESMGKMQEVAVKSLNETMLPAVGEITKLSASVKEASTKASEITKVTADGQSKAQDALTESMRGIQEAAIKSLTDTLSPAVSEISKMGASVAEATSQMSELGRNAKNSQEQIGTAITDTVKNLEKETVGATRETLKGASDSVAQLNGTIKDVAEQLKNLSTQAGNQQKQVEAALTKSIGAMQGETEKALTATVGSASDKIGALAEGIQSLNTVLAELGGKQINVQVEKKKGLFG
jgi:phage-related protein/biopolymer transport protein ExbB/TolQ